MEFLVNTPDEMREIGVSLASGLRDGDVLILNGPLGAGKTTLTQGIGEGLRVRGPITSPTFVIARVHPPLDATTRHRTPLVHVDAYRLHSVEELDDLDLDTAISTAVTVIEWGAGMAETLSSTHRRVTITPLDEELPPLEAESAPRRVTVDERSRG